jgi:hypothetical protein
MEVSLQLDAQTPPFHPRGKSHQHIQCSRLDGLQIQAEEEWRKVCNSLYSNIGIRVSCSGLGMMGSEMYTEFW